MTPDKKVYNSILETIGNTPLIKLNRVTAGLPCPVYAKVDYFNPGNSIKDRMAIKMLDVAEEKGLIKPGGTIIEGTSGNTGMGLALGAIQRGYKCIFTTTDKQSKEKVDILKAFGAQVIVCEKLPDTVNERITYVTVKDSAQALGIIAANWFGNPSEKLKLVGVTGTNGKTTTVTLLYQLFTRLGYKAGMISTVENRIGDQVIPSTHTTPDPIQPLIVCVVATTLPSPSITVRCVVWSGS